MQMETFSILGYLYGTYNIMDVAEKLAVTTTFSIQIKTKSKHQFKISKHEFEEVNYNSQLVKQI